MRQEERFTMQEYKKIEILDKLKNKLITQKYAAEALNYTVRHIRRLIDRYNKEDKLGIVHKSRGKTSNRKIDSQLKNEIMQLMHSTYYLFAPKHATEQLLKRHNISISSETLRKWMLAEGLWKKERKRKQKRAYRQQRPCFGELVQLDGSEHKWVHGSNGYWTLLLFIDDATKRVFMRFYKNESHASIADFTMHYMKQYGLPLAIYTDKGGVYKVNLNNQNDDRITQYERSLNELAVELIHAHSPQAKGRVERSFGTHQKRLVAELALAQITTMEEANIFLEKTYMQQHNKAFACEPSMPENMHRPLPQNINFNHVFSIIEKRIVTSDWTIKYHNQIIQIESTRPAIVKPKDTVIVHKNMDKTLKITIRGNLLDFTVITTLKHKQKTVVAKHVSLPYKPPLNHPWRTYQKTGHF